MQQFNQVKCYNFQVLEGLGYSIISDRGISSVDNRSKVEYRLGECFWLLYAYYCVVPDLLGILPDHILPYIYSLNNSTTPSSSLQRLLDSVIIVDLQNPFQKVMASVTTGHQDCWGTLNIQGVQAPSSARTSTIQQAVTLAEC